MQHRATQGKTGFLAWIFSGSLARMQAQYGLEYL